jgi:hypothetical protein
MPRCVAPIFTVIASFFLTAAMIASAQVAPEKPLRPKAVVALIDVPIQARFHKVNPGKFGKHALIGLGDGQLTGQIDPLDVESDQEKAQLTPLNNSHTSLVIALMHCRFKPGRSVDLDKAPSANIFKPSVEVLETISDSQDSADKLFKWSSDHADFAALKTYHKAMTDNNYDGSYHGYLIAMRPVTAHYPLCLTCHHGAKIGDTLGAIVYFASIKQSKLVCNYVRRSDD